MSGLGAEGGRGGGRERGGEGGSGESAYGRDAGGAEELVVGGDAAARGVFWHVGVGRGSAGDVWLGRGGRPRACVVPRGSGPLSAAAGSARSAAAGRNVVHQLELITDLLGTPSPEVIAKVGAGGWTRVHGACVCGGGGDGREQEWQPTWSPTGGL